MSVHYVFLTFLLVLICSCRSKSEQSIQYPPTDSISSTDIHPVTDTTIGFFLNNWQPRHFHKPSYLQAEIPTLISRTITIDASQVIAKIPISLFGVNSGWWSNVLEPMLLKNIQLLSPSIIRFPGGNTANLYFWNASKTTLPKDIPIHLPTPKGVSKHSYIYGQTSETWLLSIEQYYTLLKKTGADGMITINYSYARYGISADPVATAAHLAAEWVRYDKGRTKYWEIGNENYGKWEAGYLIDTTLNQDGQPQLQTGALYGKHFRIFADSMRKAARETGQTIYIGSVAYHDPATEHWQTKTTQTWNSEMMKESGDTPDFYILHNYFTPMKDLDAATILHSARIV